MPISKKEYQELKAKVDKCYETIETINKYVEEILDKYARRCFDLYNERLYKVELLVNDMHKVVVQLMKDSENKKPKHMHDPEEYFEEERLGYD